MYVNTPWQTLADGLICISCSTLIHDAGSNSGELAQGHDEMWSKTQHLNGWANALPLSHYCKGRQSLLFMSYFLFKLSDWGAFTNDVDMEVHGSEPGHFWLDVFGGQSVRLMFCALVLFFSNSSGGGARCYMCATVYIIYFNARQTWWEWQYNTRYPCKEHSLRDFFLIMSVTTVFRQGLSGGSYKSSPL